MSKYIRLEDAINTIRENGIYGEGHSDEERGNVVIDMLESVSTVEVREVVHAHWESYITDRYDNPDVDYRCSNCGYDDSVFPEMKYCPDCGAIMDERMVV